MLPAPAIDSLRVQWQLGVMLASGLDERAEVAHELVHRVERHAGSGSERLVVRSPSGGDGSGQAGRGVAPAAVAEVAVKRRADQPLANRELRLWQRVAGCRELDCLDWRPEAGRFLDDTDDLGLGDGFFKVVALDAVAVEGHDHGSAAIALAEDLQDVQAVEDVLVGRVHPDQVGHDGVEADSAHDGVVNSCRVDRHDDRGVRECFRQNRAEEFAQRGSHEDAKPIFHRLMVSQVAELGKFLLTRLRTGRAGLVRLRICGLPSCICTSRRSS